MPATTTSLSSYSSRRWLPGVRLESRELEQRADAVVQARHVADDGAQLVAHALLVPVDVALEQVAHRGGEGGQRRLELVGHRRQQAGLEPVGLALGGRRGRGGLQLLALQERPDEVAERGDEPGVARRVRPAVARACTVSTPVTPDGLRTGTYRPPSPAASTGAVEAARLRSSSPAFPVPTPRPGERARRWPRRRNCRPAPDSTSAARRPRGRTASPTPRRGRRPPRSGSSRPSARSTSARRPRRSACSGPRLSFSRASARASRSRMRPAWTPTMTPTTRNATRESQSLGSRISSVW